MIRLSRSLIVLVALALVSTVAVAGSPPDEPEASALKPERARDWEVSVTPYLWIPSLGGDADVRGSTADFGVSASEILGALSIGGMGDVQARWHRWLFSTDAVYSKLRGSGSQTATVGPFMAPGPIGAAYPAQDVQADLRDTFQMLIVDTKVGYRLLDLQAPPIFGSPGPGEDRRFFLDLAAGFRFWYLTSDLSLQLPSITLPDRTLGGRKFESTTRDDWFDPLVGLRVGMDVTRSVSVSMIGDVGGFGIGSASDVTWQAIGLIDYRLGQHWSLDFAYRALAINRDVIDAVLQGPAFGATYRF
jgi:hypothetical protein